MIELYGNGSPNVVKVILMCEELGLEWKLKLIDVLQGDQYEASFVAMNPNARIPVIIDHGIGSTPVTIFESAAILIHLAETRGALLPSDVAARAEVMQWTMLQATAVGPMLGQYMHFHRYAPPGLDYARKRYDAEANRLMGVFDARLEQRQFIAGAYSIADISAYPWLRMFREVILEGAGYPAIGRWLDRLKTRPAVLRAQAHADEIFEVDQVSFKDARSEQFDRLFNRSAAG